MGISRRQRGRIGTIDTDRLARRGADRRLDDHPAPTAIGEYGHERSGRSPRQQLRRHHRNATGSESVQVPLVHVPPLQRRRVQHCGTACVEVVEPRAELSWSPHVVVRRADQDDVIDVNERRPHHGSNREPRRRTASASTLIVGGQPDGFRRRRRTPPLTPTGHRPVPLTLRGIAGARSSTNS